MKNLAFLDLNFRELKQVNGGNVPIGWYMDDATIKAAILDASVRKYIDLEGRRDELSNLIDYIQSKGFAVDKIKILDLIPSEEEVWYE